MGNIERIILHDRKIAYIVTDGELNVVSVDGYTAILSEAERQSVGRKLPDVVLELAGLEEVLNDILHGRLPRFELAWVNREAPDGHTIYLDMVELPYQDNAGRIRGVLHVVQESTAAGEIEQMLAQRRNELRLLQQRPEGQNRKLLAANAELRRLMNR